MAVSIDGAGPLAGATTLNGLTIPTTGFGKVLQIVRATDTTDRSTTSTSFVDVTGMSVTITPQKSTSAILLVSAFGVAFASNAGRNCFGYLQITDSSNTGISGASSRQVGTNDFSYPLAGSTIDAVTLIAYATPATTSAVTYKLRMKAGATLAMNVQNGDGAGQMYAIEVSA